MDKKTPHNLIFNTPDDLLRDLITNHKKQGSQGRILGLDIGDKLTGVSLSDHRLMIGSVLTTLRHDEQILNNLCHLINSHSIIGIVAGYPMNMNGTRGPRCQSVEAFCRKLLSVCDLPIFLWDERLSTMAVERLMIDADLSRRKRKNKIDSAAATYILQGFLDRLQRVRSDVFGGL